MDGLGDEEEKIREGKEWREESLRVDWRRLLRKVVKGARAASTPGYPRVATRVRCVDRFALANFVYCKNLLKFRGGPDLVAWDWFLSTPLPPSFLRSYQPRGVRLDSLSDRRRRNAESMKSLKKFKIPALYRLFLHFGFFFSSILWELGSRVYQEKCNKVGMLLRFFKNNFSSAMKFGFLNITSELLIC